MDGCFYQSVFKSLQERYIAQPLILSKQIIKFEPNPDSIIKPIGTVL